MPFVGPFGVLRLFNCDMAFLMLAAWGACARPPVDDLAIRFYGSVLVETDFILLSFAVRLT